MFPELIHPFWITRGLATWHSFKLGNHSEDNVLRMREVIFFRRLNKTPLSWLMCYVTVGLTMVEQVYEVLFFFLSFQKTKSASPVNLSHWFFSNQISLSKSSRRSWCGWWRKLWKGKFADYFDNWNWIWVMVFTQFEAQEPIKQNVAV